MKKNNVKIGNLILKLGLHLKKTEYPTDTVKLGEEKRVVKICHIIREDWRIRYSRIRLSDGISVKDYRSIAKIALLLPYNHFGYYRSCCIFNMHWVKTIDRKAMSVMLDNKSNVKFETRIVFNRFDDNYLNLKS